MVTARLLGAPRHFRLLEENLNAECTPGKQGQTTGGWKGRERRLGDETLQSPYAVLSCRAITFPAAATAIR